MNRKGFGQSQPPMRDAKKFMQAFVERLTETEGDQTQIHQFFESNKAKLNESLLEALPIVFTTLTAEKLPETRQNIAYFFGAFGNLIQQFPLGNRMLNLELGVTAYQLALKVYTRETFPEDWAALQNNLGNLYSERIRGDRAENLEQSIAAYESALQVRTREAFLERWAATQNNIGNAYRDRIHGDRAENLERSITAYELALQHYTREAFPERWAMTQNNLGNAYRDRIRGDRAENLERSIMAYELALQVRTREALPERWAMTQNNLGNAYGERIRGDWAENLERSITAYGLASQVRTREAFPEKWAMTQNNLGNAYCNRIRGDRAENVEQSIAAYELALQIYTREAFPEDWAMSQGNLAEALVQRASLTESDTDLENAITLLKAALDVAAPNSPNFIDFQYRLGTVLSRRYEHSQNSSDLEQALQAYKIALDAISPEHYDRKQIWQALPTTQSILGSRLVRDGHWQEGLQLLLNSVRQLSTGDDPLAHANALFQTGRAHETLSDWDNARLYYRDALRLYDHLKNELGIAKSRAGLGSVLVSQGYLEKGLAELDKARESYHQLQQPDKAAEVDIIYQAAQRAMERQTTEAYV